MYVKVIILLTPLKSLIFISIIPTFLFLDYLMDTIFQIGNLNQFSIISIMEIIFSLSISKLILFCQYLRPSFIFQGITNFPQLTLNRKKTLGRHTQNCSIIIWIKQYQNLLLPPQEKKLELRILQKNPPTRLDWWNHRL